MFGFRKALVSIAAIGGLLALAGCAEEPVQRRAAALAAGPLSFVQTEEILQDLPIQVAGAAQMCRMQANVCQRVAAHQPPNKQLARYTRREMAVARQMHDLLEQATKAAYATCTRPASMGQLNSAAALLRPIMVERGGKVVGQPVLFASATECATPPLNMTMYAHRDGTYSLKTR
ncbi:MAG: hypothetical protein ACU0DW_05710 [Shimia sp.]